MQRTIGPRKGERWDPCTWRILGQHGHVATYASTLSWLGLEVAQLLPPFAVPLDRMGSADQNVFQFQGNGTVHTGTR